MAVYGFRFQFTLSRSFGTTAVTLAACGLSLYWLYVRPGTRHKNNKTDGVIVAKAREDTRRTNSTFSETPYPQDVFPGGREVETPYGTIQVFEWGAEDGDKVVLIHGIGTPCIALGDMAKHFVSNGCRVLLFDLFGRGYSDSPADLIYDDRLYTTQLLLALSSSSLPWTGAEGFHLVGYSLGGALSASFAAYFPHMLRSVTLVCPGGLIRPHHVSLRSRILYAKNSLVPAWLSAALVRRRLEPRSHGPSADVPVDDVSDDAGIDFDEVPLSTAGGDGYGAAGAPATVGDVMRWQLRRNEGFVGAYISTLQNSPIYGQHEGVWKRLSERLAERRRDPAISGLRTGKACIVLGSRDAVAVQDEWIEDSRRVLGENGVDIHIVPGGHEIAITKGREVAEAAMRSWPSSQLGASWIDTRDSIKDGSTSSSGKLDLN